MALILVAAGLAAHESARGQVSELDPAFETTSVEEVDGLYLYQYRLQGPDRDGDVFTAVHLDVTVPPKDEPPEILGSEGSFLFDGLGEAHGGLAYSHPSLYVVIPDEWNGVVGRTGFLSWLSDRYGDGRGSGVRSGETLEGFEVRSPGIPALRQARAVPARPIPGTTEGVRVPEAEDGEEAVEGRAGHETGVDSTWVLSDTYVLGPGWHEEQVTPEYLEIQIGHACDGLLTDRCEDYRALLEVVSRYYEHGSTGETRIAIALFRTELEEDRVLDERARRAFLEALRALEGRVLYGDHR